MRFQEFQDLMVGIDEMIDRQLANGGAASVEWVVEELLFRHPKWRGAPSILENVEEVFRARDEAEIAGKSPEDLIREMSRALDDSRRLRHERLMQRHAEWGLDAVPITLAVASERK